MASTLTVHGLVAVTVTTKSSGVRLSETGTVDLPMTLTGTVEGATAAAKVEKLRLLLELGWYSRQAGGVHLAFSDMSILDGLYLMSVDQETNASAFPRVSMTLVRLGGGGAHGSNIVRRLRSQDILTTNSYGPIGLTPRIAGMVDATALDVALGPVRSTEDGLLGLYSSAPMLGFAGSGLNKGEVKVYDTRGDGTEANWQRVFSPDHSFSDPSHLVIQNGLIRITGNATASHLGRPRIYVWTGSAYTEVTVAGGGNLAFVGTASLTAAPLTTAIDYLSPERVTVTYQHTSTGTPSVGIEQTITVYRGKPLARFVLSAPSATTLLMGMSAGRWTFTKGSPLNGSSDMQRPAFDDTEETGDVALNAPQDNWVATFTTKSSTTGTLAIGAWASSSLTYEARETGGFKITASSATSLTLWLGGVKYDTSSAQLEAEAGTLSGGAALGSTVAGASGSGNDQVILNTNGEQVEMATNLASIGGSAVVALFRIATNATPGGDRLDLVIRNTTAGSDLAAQARDSSQFAAINTWYWQGVTGTGWNGTDTLTLRAISTTFTTATFYVDQAIVVSIAGGSAEMFVDDVAGQALTESLVVATLQRQGF